MTWLNNGYPLIINPRDEIPKVIETPIEFSDLTDNYIYQCHEIFSEVNRDKNPISIEEASMKYAELFKEMNNQQFSYSLCFSLLPICVFKSKIENYREKLLKILQLTSPPENLYSQLLYYLAIKSKNFNIYFDKNGGTQPACELFLQIHHADNIDWWLQELLLYSTNLNASDFDKELINYVASNDIIECGNFFQTMILTMLFHLSKIDRQSIAQYAQENIHPNNSGETFIYNLLISNGSSIHLRDPYSVSQSSLFAVHFLNLLRKGFQISKDYQLAVLRYIEFLSPIEKFRLLIPDYLRTIISADQTVPQVLQNILPAIAKKMPDDIITETAQLEDSFEKEYSLDSIKTFFPIKMHEDISEQTTYIETLNKNTLSKIQSLLRDKEISDEIIDQVPKLETSDKKNLLNSIKNFLLYQKIPEEQTSQLKASEEEDNIEDIKSLLNSIKSSLRNEKTRDDIINQSKQFETLSENLSYNGISDFLRDKQIQDGIIEQVSKLKSEEIDNLLQFIQNFIYSYDEYIRENVRTYPNFLNDNFLETDKKVKLDIMKTFVDFPNNDSQEFDTNILQDIEYDNGSVIVEMVESYLDVKNKEKESEFLEQKLFDFIAENGDIPEYGH